MKPSPLCFLVLLLPLLGLFGCVPSEEPPPPATAELRVGLIVNSLGSYAATSGRPTLLGAQLAVDEANAGGGVLVNGRYHPIRLFVAEIEGNVPETAVAAAYHLITQENVAVIVGPQFSSDAIAVAQAAQSARIPMITPMATNPMVTADNGFAFRIGFVDHFQGQVVAHLLYDELAIGETAVLYDVANDYSRGIAEAFKQSYEAMGGLVVVYEAYTSDDSFDFTPQLTRIKESGAEALLLPNYDQQITRQALQARAMGFTAPLIGTDSWGGLTLDGRPELEGSYYTHHWHSQSDNPVSQQFIGRFQTAYPDETTVPVTAALTYDAINLLLTAVAQQEAITPANIRDGLAAIQHFNGVSGMISYHDNGDPIKDAVIIHIQEGTRQFYQTMPPDLP